MNLKLIGLSAAHLFLVGSFVYAGSCALEKVKTEHQSHLNEVSSKLETSISQNNNRVIESIEKLSDVSYVGLKDFKYDCHATNSEVSCTLTNNNKYAVSTCFFGVLSRKESKASLTSVMGCTGRMEKMSTRTISVPWDGSKAADICPHDNYKSLPDWDKCMFTVIGPDSK